VAKRRPERAMQKRRRKPKLHEIMSLGLGKQRREKSLREARPPGESAAGSPQPIDEVGCKYAYDRVREIVSGRYGATKGKHATQQLDGRLRHGHPAADEHRVETGYRAMQFRRRRQVCLTS
jgi:hypothetical protein